MTLIIEIDPTVEQVKEYVMDTTNPESLVKQCIDVIYGHERLFSFSAAKTANKNFDLNTLPQDITEKIIKRGN